MREGGRDQIKYLFDLAKLIECLLLYKLFVNCKKGDIFRYHSLQGNNNFLFPHLELLYLIYS